MKILAGVLLALAGTAQADVTYEQWDYSANVSGTVTERVYGDLLAGNLQTADVEATGLYTASVTMANNGGQFSLVDYTVSLNFGTPATHESWAWTDVGSTELLYQPFQTVTGDHNQTTCGHESATFDGCLSYAQAFTTLDLTQRTANFGLSLSTSIGAAAAGVSYVNPFCTTGGGLMFTGPSTGICGVSVTGSGKWTDPPISVARMAQLQAPEISGEFGGVLPLLAGLMTLTMAKKKR